MFEFAPATAHGGAARITRCDVIFATRGVRRHWKCSSLLRGPESSAPVTIRQVRVKYHKKLSQVVHVRSPFEHACRPGLWAMTHFDPAKPSSTKSLCIPSGRTLWIAAGENQVLVMNLAAGNQQLRLERNDPGPIGLNR